MRNATARAPTRGLECLRLVCRREGFAVDGGDEERGKHKHADEARKLPERVAIEEGTSFAPSSADDEDSNWWPQPLLSVVIV